MPLPLVVVPVFNAFEFLRGPQYNEAIQSTKPPSKRTRTLRSRPRASGWEKPRRVRSLAARNSGCFITTATSPASSKSAPRMKAEEVAATSSNQNLTALHARNFLDCMRTREKPHADVEIGHRSTSLSLMANLSLVLGQRLDWDADAERFTNSDAANDLLHYEYRRPWKLS